MPFRQLFSRSRRGNEPTRSESPLQRSLSPVQRCAPPTRGFEAASMFANGVDDFEEDLSQSALLESIQIAADDNRRRKVSDEKRISHLFSPRASPLIVPFQAYAPTGQNNEAEAVGVSTSTQQFPQESHPSDGARRKASLTILPPHRESVLTLVSPTTTYSLELTLPSIHVPNATEEYLEIHFPTPIRPSFTPTTANSPAHHQPANIAELLEEQVYEGDNSSLPKSPSRSPEPKAHDDEPLSMEEKANPSASYFKGKRPALELAEVMSDEAWAQMLAFDEFPGFSEVCLGSGPSSPILPVSHISPKGKGKAAERLSPIDEEKSSTTELKDKGKAPATEEDLNSFDEDIPPTGDNVEGQRPTALPLDYFMSDEDWEKMLSFGEFPKLPEINVPEYGESSASDAQRNRETSDLVPNADGIQAAEDISESVQTVSSDIFSSAHSSLNVDPPPYVSGLIRRMPGGMFLRQNLESDIQAVGVNLDDYNDPSDNISQFVFAPVPPACGSNPRRLKPAALGSSNLRYPMSATTEHVLGADSLENSGNATANTNPLPSDDSDDDSVPQIPKLKLTCTNPDSPSSSSSSDDENMPEDPTRLRPSDAERMMAPQGPEVEEVEDDDLNVAEENETVPTAIEDEHDNENLIQDSIEPEVQPVDNASEEVKTHDRSRSRLSHREDEDNKSEDEADDKVNDESKHKADDEDVSKAGDEAANVTSAWSDASSDASEEEVFGEYVGPIDFEDSPVYNENAALHVKTLGNNSLSINPDYDESVETNEENPTTHNWTAQLAIRTTDNALLSSSPDHELNDFANALQHHLKEYSLDSSDSSGSSSEILPTYIDQGTEMLNHIRERFSMPPDTPFEIVQGFFFRNPDVLRAIFLGIVPHPRWQFWVANELYEIRSDSYTHLENGPARSAIACIEWTNDDVDWVLDVMRKYKSGIRCSYDDTLLMSKLMIKAFPGKRSSFHSRRRLVTGCEQLSDDIKVFDEDVEKRKKRPNSLLKGEVLPEEISEEKEVDEEKEGKETDEDKEVNDEDL